MMTDATEPMSRQVFQEGKVIEEQAFVPHPLSPTHPARLLARIEHLSATQVDVLDAVDVALNPTATPAAKAAARAKIQARRAT